jgi:peptidase E
VLYVYSGDVPELNDKLLHQLGSKHLITTIPANPSDMASAKHVTDFFRHAGLRIRLRNARFYRDPRRLYQIIMNSDAVYLTGGNTFEFLDYAYHYSLFEILDEFEKEGGVIIGDSAGSIILTPNIATALIPTTCPDEHHFEMESYLGMGRIPFHISPHFDPEEDIAEKELEELQILASASKVAVKVLEDGEGFIFEGESIIHTVGQPIDLKPEDGFTLKTNVLPEWATVIS